MAGLCRLLRLRYNCATPKEYAEHMRISEEDAEAIARDGTN